MKTIKRLVTSFIVLVFLFGLLPTALALGGESVLTSVTHKNADTFYLSEDSRDITLTVRNSYGSGTIDLTNGFDIDWNENWYKSVVATPERATINIGGVDVVNLTVTFNRSSEPEGSERWETVYTIKVIRAAAAAPSFAGTVIKETNYAQDNTIEFTSADFIPKYANIDGAGIGSIAISGSNPTFGAINYDFATRPCITVNADNPNDTIFTFEATSTGTVSYNISAFAGSDTTHPIESVVVTILSYAAPRIDTPILGDVSKGAILPFSDSFFVSRCTLFGVPLEAVRITPTNTTFGTWYLGTQAFTTATTIPITQLRSLTFSANAAGAATFNWEVITKAGPSASSSGTFNITSPKLTLFPYEAVSPILRGDTWYVDLEHFDYMPIGIPINIASSMDSRIPISSFFSLLYVKISAIPAPGDGYLYLSTAVPKNDTYGFPAIAANTALNANAVIPAPYLDALCLATKTTSTNAAVTFKWTATADAKISTAVWGEPVTYMVNFKSAGVLPSLHPYYETDMNIPLPLTSDDILKNIYENIKTNFKTVTNYGLSHVTFKMPDKNIGTLYLNYDIITKAGTPVTATAKYYASKNPNLSNLTLVPAKDYTGTFDISYNAYTESGAYITGLIRIRVNSNPGGTFSYITDKNSPLRLDAKDFQAAFLSATGKSLSHVDFSPLSAFSGHLRYNHTLSGDYDSAVSSNYPYYVYKSSFLSLVTFVPTKDVTGSVVIDYTGYAEGGGSFEGKLYIYVVDSPAGIVQYSVKANSSVTLSAQDFSNEFIGVTGSLLSHVTFTPPATTVGSMFFQYDTKTATGTKVTTAIKYYDGKGPDISDITFVPAKDLTGVYTVPFTAYTLSGVSYAGKLKFTLFEGSEVISCTTEAGKPVPMNSSAFANAFYVNSNGRTLSYITLEIPASSYGKFCYNYTSPTKFDYVVTGDKKLYISAPPYLSNVSFVPQEGYTGSFSVSYTGYTSGGISTTGKMKVTVTSAQGGSVSYETNSMTPVTFKSADFVTAFAGKTGNPLKYVKFTLPYESYGTLYYRNASGSNTPVSAFSNYYVNNTPLISDITFVPNPNFTGVLAISCTAYDTYDYSVTRSVLITVKSSDIGTMTFGTNMNKPVSFDSDEMNTAFLNKTGASLYYVTFTLPPISAGKLYFGYSAPASYTSEVSASTKYYRSYSPLLSDIAFVPKTGFSGTVTIPYTGYTSNNAAYYGKLIINVDTAVPYTDMNAHTWARDAVDYLYRGGIIADDGSGHFYPGANMTRGDFMVMIANAFYLAGAGSVNFPDVPVGSRYYDAIAAAKALDIARGDDTGKFNPEGTLPRQDAMVIIVRALKNTGTPLTSGTMSNLSGFSDAALVSDYAVADVAALVRIGLVEGSGGKLNPKTIFTRAEASMLLYRILIM